LKKILFVVNSIEEFDFNHLLKKYLSNVNIFIGEDLPDDPKSFTFIVLWSYRKLVKIDKSHNNIILFHSSDLPEGKGWAPIYNTVVSEKEYFYITGILANEKVDSGDILVKARFRMKNNYTADYIREWDKEISILLLQKVLENFQGKKLKGLKQEGLSSYYPRRNPEQNEISISSTIGSIFNHLRACEHRHPAFFFINDTKFLVFIKPEEEPTFPVDLEITFYDPS